MLRRAALALAALTLTASPALADHGSTWWGHLSPRTVYFEDRTGRPDMQSWIASAVARWNTAGANITLLYRTGPATNSCSAPSYGVVRFCTVPIKGNEWFGAAFWPDASSGGHITGGEIDIRIDQLGPYGPLHEGGHALGMDESTQPSVMNQVNSGASSTPTAHDFETLRALYAHVDAVAPSTTTTTRFSICSRYPQFCR